MNLLRTYVDAWHESVEALLALAPDLSADDWQRPTDCPGWSVLDVYAHVAHLDATLAGTEPDDVPDSVDAIGRGEMSVAYTEAGVAARRHLSPDEVLSAIRTAVDVRVGQLADLPDDPSALASPTPGGIEWSWDTLLRNRCIDLWAHEQDVRRAVDRPGGFDGTAAQVVTTVFSMAMPFVLGKRVRPEPGTTVRWDVSGPVPLDLVVRIGDDGRASRVEPDDQPVTARLAMDTETFTVLTAGRRAPDQVSVSVDGDEALAAQVLAAMAITP